MSFKKWNLVDWLKGNWPTIKELIKVGLPMAIGWSVTNSPMMTGVITLGGKFILDLGHYYLKN